jgi:hypothetical protein
VATGAGVASHLRRGGHTRRRLRSASGDVAVYRTDGCRSMSRTAADEVLIK